jgi:putative IMPACT (imprinted ancient) family translation regulator
MKLINTYETIVKKSKFIGYYYSLDDIKDVDIILNNLALEHKKARHMPYAYVFNNTAKKYDDKEPSGTSGMPIYNILDKKKLSNCMIVVVRYFGGTKLGAGLLARTYGDCANCVTKND